jgi:hypothetical protein
MRGLSVYGNRESVSRFSAFCRVIRIRVSTPGRHIHMNATITKLRAAIVASVVVTSLATMCMPASAQSSEGIKVHGRWTVDVRNADGSLASHHEFDNALVIGSPVSIGGNSALAAVLGKFVKNVSAWHIQLQSNAPLCTEGTAACVINEHIGPGTAGLGELSLHVPTHTFFTTFPQGIIELNGMTQINFAAPILRVTTGLRFCRDDACTPNSQFSSQFTAHTLESPIPVVVGQVVQVKVVLSFS